MPDVHDTGVCWRPLTRDDVAALAALLRASEQVDQVGRHVDEAELAAQFDSRDLARDTLAVALPTGDLVGYASVHMPLRGRTIQRLFLSGTVHPRWRGRGLGRRLLAWQVDRATEMHREERPELPGLVTCGGLDRDDPQRRLLRRAGFVPVRWWYEMDRDLARPLPDPRMAVPPPGLVVSSFDPARAEHVRSAHNEAFTDHWGAGEITRSVWQRHFVAKQGFRPELSLLALDGSEIAGYLLTFVYPAEIAATNVRRAHISYVGTRRPWRGRGVAGSLLATALATYRDSGYTVARLMVDTANPTGALGLYERAGFTVANRFVTYGRPLAPIRE